MSQKILAWAFKARCPNPTAKLVLLKLADSAHVDGYCCCPFISLLGRQIDMNERTVRECLRLLERKRLIRIDRYGRSRTWIGYYLAVDFVNRPPRRPKASRSHVDADTVAGTGYLVIPCISGSPPDEPPDSPFGIGYARR